MQFMRCIEEEEEENAVLVHCEMGISRSATIVIAWLMFSRRMSLFDAYLYVLRTRRIIRPNAAFLEQLEAYERKLFDGQSTLDRVNKEIRHTFLQKVVRQQAQAQVDGDEKKDDEVAKPKEAH